MKSDIPQNWNGREAFWTPELSFLYVSTAGGALPAALQPDRPTGWFRRSLRGLKWQTCAVLEHLLLALALCASLLPRWEAGRIPDLARRGLKRGLDILGASVGLILALPIFLVVPILIKLDSPGPVFYTQTRVGLDRRRRPRRQLRVSMGVERRDRDRRRFDQSGRVFKLIKFRSMVQNAERKCGPVWASRNDPRITRLGRFLRHTRLDEVPQLVNVLLGQMSLVGPRPERPHFVSRFCNTIEHYPSRHRVKPGITGLAQIEHGYDRTESDVQRKVEYDLQYIRQWNPVLDLRILMRTVRVVFSGRGAH